MKPPKISLKTPSERVIFVGGSIMAFGMLMSVVAITPLVTNASLGAVWWFLAMLTGVGFSILLIGIRIAAKERTRLVRKHLQGDTK